MEEFVLNAKTRGSTTGTRATRRLRAEGFLPANIYGHGKENLLVLFDAREFRRFFDAGHRAATIRCDGQEEHGILKEVQYDSMGTTVVHVDFTRVSRDETIVLEVPVAFAGHPKGVVTGGVLQVQLHELRVRGPAAKIPEHIALNIEELKIGESIRIRDIQAPADCELADDPDRVIVAVTAPHIVPTETPAPGPSEPEVIGRKKEAGEEEAT